MSVSRRAWAALAVTHHWLGVAGCLLFVVWFVSGIAMVYVRMPELTATERLAHAPPIDATTVRLGPDEARRAGGAGDDAPVVLEMLGSRAVYRLGSPPVTVFADTGERLDEVTAPAAAQTAAAFAAGAAVRHRGVLDRPDQ